MTYDGLAANATYYHTQLRKAEVANEQLRKRLDALTDGVFDEGGLPIHLPMGVNANGNGPVPDNKVDHYVCWCNKDDCLWNLALSHNLEIL